MSRTACWIMLFMLAAATWLGLWLGAARYASLEERGGQLLVLATVAIYCMNGKRALESRHATCRHKFSPASKLIIIALLLLYAIAVVIGPELGVILLALVIWGTLLGTVFHGRSFHVALIGLMTLAAPVIPRLQFYLGYPLRQVVAMLSTAMLRISGFDVVREGVAIGWHDELIVVDAPCSGVRMLWVGAYLILTLCCFYHMNYRRSIVACLLTLLLILPANAWRSTMLFVVDVTAFEALSGPTMHSAIGLATYGVTMALIIGISVWLQPKHRIFASDTHCSTSSSFLPGIFLILMAIVAAVSPWLRNESWDRHLIDSHLDEFPGWPSEYEGVPITPIELHGYEKEFARKLPGMYGKFQAGERELVLQWLVAPSRYIHSATECMEKAGYVISNEPLYVDAEGNRWSSYRATRQKQALRVRHRIHDQQGRSWSDISAWYWSSRAGKDVVPPYWCITVIEPID